MNDVQMVSVADAEAATFMAGVSSDPGEMASGLRDHPEFGGAPAADALLRILSDSPSAQAVESLVAYAIFLHMKGGLSG